MKKNIRHSVYKLARIAKCVQKKHIYDAQNILNNIDNKASGILVMLLNSARKNGV